MLVGTVYMSDKSFTLARGWRSWIQQ